MYKTGHYGVSLLLYAPILALLLSSGEAVLGAIGLSAFVLTASLPDIDIKPPFRYVISHRTWTHSVWFGFLIGGLFGGGLWLFRAAMSQHSPALLVGFGFLMGFGGVLAHLVGDVLNHSGIQPLYPVGPRYSLHLTSAKGLWWFESVKSGNQQNLTFWERTRHRILNSNRVFLLVGAVACAVAAVDVSAFV